MVRLDLYAGQFVRGRKLMQLHRDAHHYIPWKGFLQLLIRPIQHIPAYMSNGMLDLFHEFRVA